MQKSSLFCIYKKTIFLCGTELVVLQVKLAFESKILNFKQTLGIECQQVVDQELERGLGFALWQELGFFGWSDQHNITTTLEVPSLSLFLELGSWMLCDIQAQFSKTSWCKSVIMTISRSLLEALSE